MAWQRMIKLIEILYRKATVGPGKTNCRCFWGMTKYIELFRQYFEREPANFFILQTCQIDTASNGLTKKLIDKQNKRWNLLNYDQRIRVVPPMFTYLMFLNGYSFQWPCNPWPECIRVVPERRSDCHGNDDKIIVKPDGYVNFLLFYWT